MNVLSSVGQVLHGHAIGDVVEVRADSGGYLVEITAIELP
jgi:transcription elongation GreA/GreB family factor